MTFLFAWILLDLLEQQMEADCRIPEQSHIEGRK